ncbi:hypothetical protein P9112_013520 [Eukaryota sp. TZLM1-RC]
MISPFQLAGYALDPLFIDDWVNSDDRIMSALEEVATKLLDSNLGNVVLFWTQFLSYKEKNVPLSRPEVLAAVQKMPAYKWWTFYGSKTPLLQQVAVRVLAQVLSVSACERNWSAYEGFHTKKRSRMQVKRTEKIVFCKSNESLVKTLNTSEA